MTNLDALVDAMLTDEVLDDSAAPARTRLPVAAPRTPVARPAPTPPPPEPSVAVARLLDAADNSPHARVRAAAKSARTAFDRLYKIITEEQAKAHAAREASAARERERRERETQRSSAMEELRQAEARLRAAKEHARLVMAAQRDPEPKPKRTYSPETLEKMRASAARMRERKAAARAAAGGGK